MSDLDILKAAGFNLDELTPGQAEAVGNLSREDLESLAAIRTKLNEETDEVAGHARGADPVGLFVW